MLMRLGYVWDSLIDISMQEVRVTCDALLYVTCSYCGVANGANGAFLVWSMMNNE